MGRAKDAVARILGSPDGRWTLVSTSITASVAATVTWLAVGAQPSSLRLYEPRREQASLNSDLLSRLSGILVAHGNPSDAAGFYRQAGLIAPASLTGPLDRLLSAEHETKSNIETKTLRMSNGDTIMGVLQEAGVSAEDASAVVDAMKPLYSPRSIRSGQTFEATFGPVTSVDATNTENASVPSDQTDSDDSADRRLLSLSFSPSIEHQITVKLTVPDGYLASDIQRKLEGRYERAGATIDCSLYLAAVQAGIPPNIVVELIRMFSYDVDFQRDVQPGDGFEVVFNRLYTPEGQPAKLGDIISASMVLSGKKKTLYRYESANGDEEYFDSNGQSAKSMLMKTPVDGARISSSFGRRFHPILGYNRMHKGIDFAVPSGTPVMAAGNGSVTYAGPAGEYGNLVVITHSNGYATAYGHLSRFAVKTGTRVHQGQVVAYSGATGLATGPHLHYEIRVNNSQVNPAAVKVASGRTLTGEDREAFMAERTRIDSVVASLPIQHQLAQATGLRESSPQ